MFEYLSKEAINSMLPQGLRISDERGKYNIYPTENGDLIVATESKNVSRSNRYVYEVMYSLYLDLYLERCIKYVCLSIYNDGVLLIPIDDLIQIKDKLESRLYPLGRGEDKEEYIRYDLKAYIENEKITLFRAKNHYEMDLTKYFIPYSNDESFFIELDEYDRSKIYEDAINFKEYDKQYVLGNDVKRRIESKKQKERIAILENHTCQICGFYQSYINQYGHKRYIIEVDHIIEKSKGGGENMHNLLVLCPNCHAKKTYGIITIDDDYRVYENGQEIKIKDHHLK
jgi:hypothetical protein